MKVQPKRNKRRKTNRHHNYEDPVTPGLYMLFFLTTCGFSTVMVWDLGVNLNFQQSVCVVALSESSCMSFTHVTKAKGVEWSSTMQTAIWETVTVKQIKAENTTITKISVLSYSVMVWSVGTAEGRKTEGKWEARNRGRDWDDRQIHFQAC